MYVVPLAPPTIIKIGGCFPSFCWDEWLVICSFFFQKKVLQYKVYGELLWGGGCHYLGGLLCINIMIECQVSCVGIWGDKFFYFPYNNFVVFFCY